MGARDGVACPRVNAVSAVLLGVALHVEDVEGVGDPVAHAEADAVQDSHVGFDADKAGDAADPAGDVFSGREACAHGEGVSVAGADQLA